MDPIVLVVLLLVLLAAGVGGLLWHRRVKYIATFTDRGWQFNTSPDIDSVYGLNCPPFGIGTNRKVDDQVVGTTSGGISFQSIEYSSSSVPERRYAMVKLPRSLPELHVTPPQAPRAGVGDAIVLDQSATHTVATTDPEHGRALLDAIGPTLGRYPTQPNLTIDHDTLVAVDAPSDAESLAVLVDAMEATALALGASPAVHAISGPTPPPRLGLYGLPGFEFRNRDDSVLGQISHSEGGRNHRAEDIVLSDGGPLPFISCTHRWETQRTVTTRNSDGTTSTRTVTDHHTEHLLEYRTGFRFLPFKVNRGLIGDRVRFEWHDFNERFTVRCANPRFAHDVFHPRQLEYLMGTWAPPFELDQRGAIHVDVDARSLQQALRARDFLLGFFGRVPRFVWQDLGMAEPPLELLRGDI